MHTHFSSNLLLHPNQPTLSTSSALFSAPASPRFLSHQHVLRPHETHTPSTASTFVFLCLHTRLPLSARSSSTACTLGFHSKHTRLPQQAHSFSTAKSTCLPLPERLPPHCQNICLPPTTQSSSTTRTFGFLCQHAHLPQPARSASPVRTLIIRSQPNHTPNLPAPLHPFKQQGQHADVAQHAALAVMVSARQASMRCGGEP